MKRVLSVFLIVSFVFCSVFITGCGKCNHSGAREVISDTATCESDGMITYRCTKCGEKITESSPAKGHDWIEISSTKASCTQTGVVTYKCNRCRTSKQKSVPMERHSYGHNGICQRCGQFEYNISVAGTLPKTLRYGSPRRSIGHITKVEFVIGSIGGLEARFYGKKTFDIDGTYGTASVAFLCVLKDSDGNIITTKHVYISGLIVNQPFGASGYYDTQLCWASDLSVNKSYVLEIVEL